MLPFTGDADVDFALLMRERHISAVRMASHYLRHSEDTEMQAMAREIVAAHTGGIRKLDRLLEDVRPGGAGKPR